MNMTQRYAQGYQLGEKIKRGSQRNLLSQLMPKALSGTLDAESLSGVDPKSAMELTKINKDSINNNISQDEEKQKRFYKTAEAYRGLMERKVNPETLQREILKNIDRIESEGGDPRQQVELFQTIQSGDLNKAAEMVNTAVILGQEYGFLDKPKPVKKEFKDGFVFNPMTGEVTQPEIVAQVEAKKNQGQELTRDDKFKYNDKITSFLKDTVKINQSAKDLSALNENSTPTDQLAAIFKFMKSLDPTSVVREGEQQMARSTGGPADAFIGYVNQIRGEGGLTPTAFANMVNTAKILSNASVDGSTREVNKFLDTFDISQGFRTKLTNRIPEKLELSNVQNKALSAIDQQALDWANSNPNDPRATQIKQRLGM